MSTYGLGVLSDSYIALYELYSLGSVRKNQIEQREVGQNSLKKDHPYKYLSRLTETYTLQKYDWIFLKCYINGIEQFKSPTIESPFQETQDISITQEGISYIKEDIKRRKQRFNIKSWPFENAYFNMLIENKSKYSDFEKEVAIVHNGINKDNSLTKVAEKYLIKSLADRINHLTYNTGWTTDSGPNMNLHTLDSDFSNWKEIVKLDFKLLHKLPDIGGILLTQLRKEIVDYATILITSANVEEVYQKIKEFQKQELNSFPFCYE